MKSAKIITAIILAFVFVSAAALPAFAEGDTIISEVRLTVTEPKAGAAPDVKVVSAEPEKYTATVRYWLKTGSSDNKVTVFEEGCEYALVVDINPASGFRFETPQKNGSNEESPTVVYINNVKTRCVSWETETKLSRAYYVSVAEEAQEETNFFTMIINAIRDFFAGIVSFFKNLF